MYEIISILDKAGAPLCTDDKLILLLNNEQQMGLDIKILRQRSVFKSNLTNFFGKPKFQVRMIESNKVFRFNFLDMLKYLIMIQKDKIVFYDPTLIRNTFLVVLIDMK